ncbi:MAG: UTP--glucose-1-phosphate uridylyltransferase [Planctomycetes bacterium]|nr:UTP--glucose-1-phosphate uridylyltransferase [Planctomycetota bacterium]
MNLQKARQILLAENQSHLLSFWDSLSPTKQAKLLEDIEAVDWKLLGELIRKEHTSHVEICPENCKPPAAVTLASGEGTPAHTADARKIGEGLLRDNRVAALTVAGGQGTRLGFAGPKGMFPITPVQNKTLFAHFAESIAATNRRYECNVPWLIMTSPDNHSATVNYFRDHDFLGLPEDRVMFFQQGVMPAISEDGRVLLADRHRIAFSPDGHGGTLRALHRSGLLDELQAQRCSYISYFQIDNPLLLPLDPVFIGLVHKAQSQVGSKVVRKAADAEKVGVFIDVAGTTRVVEYTVLPDQMARRRNPDGTRTFDFANIAGHILDVAFIQELVARGSRAAMPWCLAHKKVTHFDPNAGRLLEPHEPNAYKAEQFIFDTIPLARNPLQYEVQRCEEFGPVKNAEGQDSPETARAAMSAKAVRWLAQCGRNISDASAPAQPLVEISPLFALDVEELKERLRESHAPDASGQTYFGP